MGIDKTGGGFSTDADDDETTTQDASTKARKHKAALSVLPEDGGILNERGHLFYHDTSVYRVPEWDERLEQHGIRLRSGHFSDAEKEKIRNNWKTYAAAHGVDEAAIFRLTKTQSDMHPEELKNKLEFVRRTALWPALCRGLEDRTASSVRYVIPNMFGPKGVPKFHPTNYLADPARRSDFMGARLKYEDDRTAIAIALGLSCNQVTYLYNIVMNMERPIAGHVLARMWKYIPHCVRSDVGLKAFTGGRAVKDHYINWTRLAFLTKRMVPTCKNTFKAVYPKVAALMKEGLSADEAIAKVCGSGLPRMQPHDLCSFARLVRDQLSASAGASLVSARIGRLKQTIENEMERLGVYGFYTGKGTPFSHCRARLMQLLRNIRLHVMPRLTLHYSLQDLLTVVVRTLEDYYMSGEAENEMEEEEQGVADGEASGAVKKLNGIRVATGDLVAHLFLYTREEICEDFVPPWKFKQIVPARFSSVLALFDETRENDFYISSTDVNRKKKLIRESTVLDEEKERLGEDLLREEEDGESTDEEELVRVCSGKKKDKGGAKEQRSVQETTPTGDEDDVATVSVKNKKGREEKDQMEKEEDVSVSERKKRKKEKKEKRRLEEQREQEEQEEKAERKPIEEEWEGAVEKKEEEEDIAEKKRKKERKSRKRLREMEQEEEEEERKEKGRKNSKKKRKRDSDE